MMVKRITWCFIPLVPTQMPYITFISLNAMKMVILRATNTTISSGEIGGQVSQSIGGRVKN